MAALVFAFMLVAVALLSMDYLRFRSGAAQQGPLQDSADALLGALPDDVEDAVLVLRASELQYNRLRQRAGPDGAPLGDLLIELSKPLNGPVVFASRGLAALSLPVQNGPATTVAVRGGNHWSVQAENLHWRVRLLEPTVADTTALRWFAGNLVRPMLIAFALVLIPLWWAVRRGLSPLRKLTTEVAGRRVDDFAPLALICATPSCSRWLWRSTICWIDRAPPWRVNAPLFKTPPMSCAHRWRPSLPKRMRSPRSRPARRATRLACN